MKAVYDCWATGTGICAWFLSSASYTNRAGASRGNNEAIRQGDHYVWQWHNWIGEEKGEILEANGKDSVAFTFAGGSVVRIVLEEAGGQTLLSLTQAKIPPDEESRMRIYVGCNTGWTFWLTNLKAYLEHGILLNETETDLSGDPDASFVFVNI
jgi:uncharacterized protein YndB with AHSA1/START domain